MSSLFNNINNFFSFSSILNNNKNNSPLKNNQILSLEQKKFNLKRKSYSSLKLPILNPSHIKNKSKFNINNNSNKDLINDILLEDKSNFINKRTSLSNYKTDKKKIRNMKSLNLISPIKKLYLINQINEYPLNTINLDLNKNLFIKMKNLKENNNELNSNIYNNNDEYIYKEKNNINLNILKEIEINEKKKRYKIKKNKINNKNKYKIRHLYIDNEFSEEDKRNTNIDLYPKINLKYSNENSNDFNENNTNKIEELNNNMNDSESIFFEQISDNNILEYYIQNCYCIKEFAYKEDQNQEYRQYMEDKSKSVINLNNNKNNILFCIFDGHGGNGISSFLQNNFYYEFKEMLENNIGEEPNFNQVFEILDKRIKKLPFSYNQGSTACIVYITKKRNKKILYCANIGDTRCLLTNEKYAKRLSHDHKIEENENERERIIDHGGKINKGRIFGDLILSRAFGDWRYKEFGLISSPYINKIEINDDDKYIIIASDGVWDVLDDLEVYKLSLMSENSKELCSNIIDNSLKRKSKDNLSCFVIKL